MNIKKSVDAMLNQEMSRREFLAHLGIVALAVTGITNVLKTITKEPRGETRQGAGYGGSAYGR